MKQYLIDDTPLWIDQPKAQERIEGLDTIDKIKNAVDSLSEYGYYILEKIFEPSIYDGVIIGFKEKAKSMPEADILAHGPR
ncbi:MAG: hypothetical protein ACJA0N_002688 [Pseudohongiellaceae bacterium]|jgi:hypothetical protein